MAEEAVNFEETEHTEIMELFHKAKRRGVAGDFEGKKRIYIEEILTHPYCSENARVRVAISIADLLRRHGDPDRALSQLQQITPGDNPVTRFEHLQACSQVWMMRYFQENSKSALNKAIELQQSLLKLVRDYARELPPDLRAYARESFSVMKAVNNEFDADYLRCVDELEEAIELIPDRKVKRRAWVIFAYLKGDENVEAGDYLQACQHYRKAFIQSMGAYHKLSAAIRFLYAFMLQNEQDTEEMAFSKRGVKSLVSYIEEHLHEMPQISIMHHNQIQEISQCFPGLNTKPSVRPVQ